MLFVGCLLFHFQSCPIGLTYFVLADNMTWPICLQFEFSLFMFVSFSFESTGRGALTRSDLLRSSSRDWCFDKLFCR